MDEKEVKKEFLKFAENLFKKAGALSVKEMKKNEEVVHAALRAGEIICGLNYRCFSDAD